MKYSALMLFAVLSLGLVAPSYAKKTVTSPCGTWPIQNDMKCADKGGTIVCTAGNDSPMCCRKVNGHKTCTDNPDTLSSELPAANLWVAPGGKAVASPNPEFQPKATGVAPKSGPALGK